MSGESKGPDVQYTLEKKFSFDGKRMREEVGRNGKNDFIASFDCELSKHFSPKGAGGMEFPSGNIMDEDFCSSAAQNVHIQPILWAFMPLESHGGGFAAKNLRVSSTKGRIDNRDCIIVNQEIGTVDDRVSFWLDPELDYCIVRYDYKWRGNTLSQIDISYEADTVAGWVPVRWTVTSLEPTGRPYRVIESTVTSYEINPSFADDEFVIDFPAGTIVTDNRY